MSKSSAASQDFVTINDIRNDVVILKNGGMCSILLASSINFALKSTDEQEAILQQFQTFLNTLDFSLQIFAQSRRLNIEPYLALLKTREKTQENDLMRIQLSEYMGFIRSFTEEVSVMSKNFFVVIPYTPTGVNITRGFTSLFSSNRNQTIDSVDQAFEENKIQLEHRINLVSESLSGIGVRTVQLKTDDLVELFYHTYNPTDPTGVAPKLNA